LRNHKAELLKFNNPTFSSFPKTYYFTKKRIMKNLLFVFIFAPLFSYATNPVDDGLSTISQAISKGDVETLSGFFDSQVEIAVLDDEDYYSKDEAKGVISRFFKQHQPKSFQEMHQGMSKGKDSTYCIGNLVSNSGTFRVYVYMKMGGDKPLIQELRFDKE